MQIMILTMVYESKCMWVVLAQSKQSEEKESLSQVSEGLMWHLFVNLSVVDLKDYRDQVGNQHQVGNGTQIP